MQEFFYFYTMIEKELTWETGCFRHINEKGEPISYAICASANEAGEGIIFTYDQELNYQLRMFVKKNNFTDNLVFWNYFETPERAFEIASLFAKEIGMSLVPKIPNTF